MASVASGAGASVVASGEGPANDAVAVQGGVAPSIRLLVGGAPLQPTDQPAVIRIPLVDGADADPADDAAGDPVTCLTQAVYYEARSESLAGQEAVAQVVINRTRLAPYPASVCGVVFQGAGDTHGCQFSFACDGSMDRATDWAAWDRARAVAVQALGGFVFKPLKDAIHYHAAWMTPYWSSSLTRLRQLGGHVFYR